MVESDVAVRKTPVQIGGFEQKQKSLLNMLANVGIMRGAAIAIMSE
jgi:hypothetical protein